MRLRGSGEAAAVVLGAFVLACVFTYPYIIHFNNAGASLPPPTVCNFMPVLPFTMQ